MKTCKTCGVQKPLEAFAKARVPAGKSAPRGGMGVSAYCNYCKAEKRSPGIHARREAEENKRQQLFAEGLKECTKCKAIKPKGEYNVRKKSPDGLMQKCRECCRTYATAYRADNTDCHKAYYAENKDKRSEEFKQWRQENSSRRAEYMLSWSRANSAQRNESHMRWQACRKTATPKWANREKMVEFYKLAERMTAETGVQHHVDHIYPLQSKQVCGLHCEANLNVITQFENIQKLNRMPTEEYLQRCKR